MTRAFVFPGQGSQSVGMGFDLVQAFPAARLAIEEVDDALGQHLSRLMFEGPEDELTLTENAQPALMAVSLAVLAVLREEGNMELAQAAGYVAGHSLGEYSALAAVGAFHPAQAARLLKVRGRAMQKAVPVGEGAMAALLGLELEDVFDIARQAAEAGGGDDVCAAANDNAPGQVVVSGTRAAVERAMELAKEKGARRAILLPVSAPFHCLLMAPAAEVMEKALSETVPSSLAVPLIANVTARPVHDPGAIRSLLVAQVTGMVRWRECVLTMKELGVDTVVELGVGKVLTGLTRRIDRDLTGLAVGTPEGVEAFLKTL
jgi:[acyl-carrier-protein] S-malonyltransferase